MLLRTFTGLCQIMPNSPRGSLWNKWDLHVHTPFSVEQHYGDSNRNDVWNQFFEDIESLPPEIKVLGINDYIFVDGYERVLQAKKDGRLENIELILPVIELRIERFSGTDSKLKRLNFHVIFSDKVPVDVIRTQFINRLSAEYSLSPEYESLKRQWNGVATPESLSELGQLVIESTPEAKRSSLPSPKQVGFNSLNYPLEKVYDCLKHHNFQDNHLTAFGLSEWSQLRLDGGGAASKISIINNVDLAFTAAKTVEDAQRNIDKLRNDGVNCHLLHCSDAHYFSNSTEHIRLGHCFTWIKADTTFEGLKLAVRRRYDDRICIAHEPDKLIKVRSNRTKYIKSIEIRRCAGATLEENWFNCKLNFSHDLVAVIGSKGNGKSALTDIIALCGSTKVGDFSFLSRDRFRDRQGKAENFEAQLDWENGTSTSKRLSDTISQHESELVRYVPQSFFEKVTNEVIVSAGSDFYRELYKVIFSHIPEPDRLGLENLDQLLEHHKAVVQESLDTFRRQLRSINTEISRLEVETSDQQLQQVFAQIEAKKRELVAHDAAQPLPIKKPEEQSIQSEQLEICRNEMESLRQQADEKRSKLTSLKKRYSVVQQVLARLHQLVENINLSRQSYAEDLSEVNVDIDLDLILQIKFNPILLEEYEAKLLSYIGRFEQELDPQNLNGLIAKLQASTEKANQFQEALNTVESCYQNYLDAYQEWEFGRTKIIGSLEDIDSLTYLEEKLRRQREELPDRLNEQKKQRRELTQNIYGQLELLKQIYEDLANSVQTSINQHDLTRAKYGLDFKVILVYSSFIDKFIEFINHGRTGSFMGKEAGRERLQEICRRYDFYLGNDAVTFAEEILNNLTHDCRCEPPTKVEISAQLKQTTSDTDVYDFLFGLEYLQPEYSLQLDGKEMKQLSPGERGVLLLIFYLLIDKEDCPLLIDQPEENLDNQSVYNLLVPAIKEAKKRRQIFLVTHNPNLAVVCDAEQLIHASMDKHDGNRVNYQSGAIENPMFNKLALDILEGTQPAFDVRRGTYVFNS